MVVGSLEIHLRLAGSHSLKEKRRVIRPILEALHRELGVSAAEVGDLELWGNATLGVAWVAANRATAQAVRQKVLNRLETFAEADIAHVMDALMDPSDWEA